MAVFRQVTEFFGLADIFFPAWELNIFHFHPIKVFQRSRNISGFLVIKLVAHPDFDCLKAGKDIKFSHVDTRDSVDINCVFNYHQIQPAAAARAASGRSVFCPLISQHIPFHSTEFCWKRASADTSGIGFYNPNHIINFVRRKSKPCACPSCSCIGGSHIRVCSMVNIQLGALSAFNQDCFSFFVALMQEFSRVDDVSSDNLQCAFVIVNLLFNIKVKTISFHVLFRISAQFFSKFIKIQQVSHSYPYS